MERGGEDNSLSTEGHAEIIGYEGEQTTSKPPVQGFTCIRKKSGER